MFLSVLGLHSAGAESTKDGLPPITLETIKGHFSTITRHKLCVMQLCFKVGLYKQGLLHDNSKYAPTEFLQGIRFWQGTRSPNDAERRTTGVSRAWLHHKGLNKHHLEYWIDYDPVKRDGSLAGAPMPTRYLVEMFCDRIAACKVYQGDAYTHRSPWEYYVRSRDRLTMHPDSQAVLEGMLSYLAEHGEDQALATVRRDIVEARFTFGPQGRF